MTDTTIKLARSVVEQALEAFEIHANHYPHMVEKQPEALRLADELCAAPERSRTSFEAAAELRRLHAENEAAHCVGIQQERDLMAVEAQRDALLTALKTIVRWDSHTQEFAVDYGSSGVRDFYRQIAQEAIAKAERADND